MFRRIDADEDRAAVTPFTWEGDAFVGWAGDTVAAALLGAGIRVTRTHPTTHEGRAPYCMMGACYECLVEIDGAPNRQACQVLLQPGMAIAPQRGARR
ncbi:MAG: (2Fe-2S)-binding protein [Paracoccaceae bacterium]